MPEIVTEGMIRQVVADVTEGTHRPNQPYPVCFQHHHLFAWQRPPSPAADPAHLPTGRDELNLNPGMIGLMEPHPSNQGAGPGGSGDVGEDPDAFSTFDCNS